jgi:hypothetical protein
MNSCVPPSYAQVFMPKAGEMVALSSAFHPSILTGVKVYARDPFRLDFIMDPGEQKSGQDADAQRLIRYFLASLTVPEQDLWVNLSPYENDRIVPDAFGRTEMGRDLLAQDYLLKQVTSSLMYPEDGLGKTFWADVYEQAQEQFGTTDIPVDTFNKVWIVPAKAVVYEKPDASRRSDEAVAYVVGAHLKVMLESDYLAMEHNGVGADLVSSRERADIKSAPAQELTQGIIRKIIIPALEKEVNEGWNFVQLRQVYNSFILAAWYKKKIKQSLLAKVYVDQKKVRGVNIDDPQEAEKIWGQYVEAFRKGVFDLVKEEEDQYTLEMIPRKYFSGGVTLMDAAMDIIDNSEELKGHGMILPEEALLIRMNLRAEPPEGDIPSENPVFYSQQVIHQRIVETAPRLKDVFSEYGFGSGPEIMAAFGRVFKLMQRQEDLDIERLLQFVSERLSQDRDLLFRDPGLFEQGITSLLGTVNFLLRGQPLSSYGQQEDQQVEIAQRLLKTWAGADLDPESILFDYNMDLDGSGNFRNSSFIQMTIVPVQYGVSVPVLVHESLHHVFPGFDAIWLTEAVTQRMSLEILGLQRLALSDSFRSQYQQEQRMLRKLAEVIGGYAPIILAYSTGEAGILFEALGPNADLVWRLMEALDDIEGSTVFKEKMLEAILKNLGSRDVLVRLGDVFRQGHQLPFRLMPLIAQDLKKNVVRSPAIEDIRSQFLSREMGENVVLERSISAYIEGLDEEDLFISDDDLAMASVDAAEDIVADASEAMPLLTMIQEFLKKKDRQIPGGKGSMKTIASAVEEPGSPLASYQVTEFLKEEDVHAFKVAAQDPGKSPTMLKIFLDDEDLFNGRPREAFDAPVLNEGKVVVHAESYTGGSFEHWRGWRQMPNASSWRGSKWGHETITFIEQPFLDGRPTQEEVDVFKETIKEKTVNGYGYKAVGNWSVEQAPIRCALDDKDRKFYLMDPYAVRKIKDMDHAQTAPDNIEAFTEAAGSYWQAMADVHKKFKAKNFDSLPGSQADREALREVLLQQGYFISNDDMEIQGAKELVPEAVWMNVRYVIQALKENVEQHVGGMGELMIHVNTTAGKVFVAMLDNGPGFPVDQDTGKPLINLHEYKGFIQVVQRKDSPGRGIALGSANRIAAEFRIFSQGYMRDLKRITRMDNDLHPAFQNERIPGAMVVAEIDLFRDVATGGIDLTVDQNYLQTTGSGADMAFDLDPAELRRFQNAGGFVPVIMNIQPMDDLPAFLGLTSQLN